MTSRYHFEKSSERGVTCASASFPPSFFAFVLLFLFLFVFVVGSAFAFSSFSTTTAAFTSSSWFVFPDAFNALIKSPCFAIASVKSSSVLDARVLTDDDDDDENVLGVVVVVVV